MAIAIITLDAIIAATLSAILIAAAVDLLGQREMEKQDILLQYGYSLLAASDKSGTLAQITEFNSSEFKDMLQLVPEHICIEAELYLENGSIFYHADNYNESQIGKSTGCRLNRQYGKLPEIVTASRTVVNEGDIYPALIKLWYKDYLRESEGISI